MLIAQWPLARIIPYPKNARKIPRSAIEKVAASLKEFGWRQPIVVDTEGVIVIGHVRRAAAEALTWSEAPVHVAAELSPAQIKALRIADNRLHEEASWDLALLEPEMIELKGLGMDLGLTGFSTGELDRLLRTPSEREEETPARPETPTSERGDVWTLGGHRVMCGDAESAADVAGLLGDSKPFLMVTDPPYGVGYDASWRVEAGINMPWQKTASGKVKNDDRADWVEAWKLCPAVVAYVWHGALHAAVVAQSLEAAGFGIRSQIIWAKTSIVMGRGHYHWQHEPCWYASRGTASWQGDRKQSTLWSIPNMHVSQGNVDDGKTIHSTQKPVECMRRPMLNHTELGASVYDPFLGSGTTLIAAETSARWCFGLEIDPGYVDVIVKRWEAFAGKTAYHADGRTFARVATERFLIRLGAQDQVKEEVIQCLMP